MSEAPPHTRPAARSTRRMRFCAWVKARCDGRAWNGTAPWLVGVLGAVPLWGVVPSMDWLQHVAVVDILARLWGQDTTVLAHYTWQLQPVAYHLLYLVWTPLALLLGTQASARTMLILLYTAHLAAMAWGVRRLGGPRIMHLSALPLFYSLNFVWGFAPTLAGMPLMLCLAVLLSGAISPRWERTKVAACAGCATLSHVVFWPLCVVFGAVAVCTQGRKAAQNAWVTAASSSVVALPGIWHVWQRRTAEAASPASIQTFESLVGGLRHIGMALRCMDHSFYQTGQVACLLVVVAAAAWPKMATTPTTQAATQLWPQGASHAAPMPVQVPRTLVGMGMVSWGFVWLVPLVMDGPGGQSWLLNMRFVPLGLACWTLATAASPLWRSRRAAPARALWCVGCACMVLGTARLGGALGREVAPYTTAMQMHNVRGALAVYVAPERFARTWPPLARHMAAQAFVGRLSWQGDLFAGGHLPICERRPDDAHSAQAAAAALAVALMSPNAESLPGANAIDAAAVALWRTCDAALLQHPNAGRWPLPSSADAAFLGRGPNWLLLGPPNLPLLQAGATRARPP